MIEIRYRPGNLLDVKSGYIVHGCNAQGVMGSGVALAVKQKYPQAYETYLEHLNGMSESSEREYMVGTNDFCKINDDLWVVNAITQETFGHGARYVSYDAIDECFSMLFHVLAHHKNMAPPIVNFPMIGAGLGGGDWDTIKMIIQKAANKSNVPNLELVCWVI